MKINKDSEELEVPEIEYPCEVVVESNLNQVVIVCGAHIEKGSTTVDVANEDFAIKFVNDCHALSLMNDWGDFVTLTFQPKQEAEAEPKAEAEAEAKAKAEADSGTAKDAETEAEAKKDDSGKKADSKDAKAEVKTKAKEKKAPKKAK